MNDFELIVVDDASQDSSPQVVQAFNEPRLRFIQNERNRGIGGAKNVGMAAARGQFIAFLDSDDEWLPEKLELQLAVLRQSPLNRPLSFSAFWIHRDGSGSRLSRRPHRYGTWLRSIVLGEHFSLGSTLFASKQCFETIGVFDERLRRLEDRDWMFRYLSHYDEFEFVPQPLAHIYNIGFPKAETVRASVEGLYESHAGMLRQRDPGLARSFRTGLDFEVAVAQYREGNLNLAAGTVLNALVRDPAYTAYLGRRVGRKLLQWDLT